MELKSDCLMCGQPLGKHSHTGECNTFIGPDDVVGHKTFDTGERDENGMPKFRHEPLTRAEGEALWASAEAAKAKRAAMMPDEQAAIHALWDAHQRLKELGWRDGKYSPRDGTRFKTIEVGSTGIFDGDCHGEWPDCTWTTYDGHDAYPSSQPPALFKLYPEDQAKYDAKMAARRSQSGTTRSTEEWPARCRHRIGKT
jgi:hypothetical protein